MKAKLSTIVVVLSLTLLPSAAAAGTILSAASGGWEYTFTNPTADPTWNTTTGTPGWLTGAAPFGNTADPNFGFTSGGTFWPADGSDGDDLWVKKAVDFTGFDLSSIVWNLGVDNGFKLYLNGALISSANAEGFTFKWEYSGAFGGAALPAMNILAVALEDHGGLTGFDMEILGDATAVPDGGITALLLGVGVFGLGYVRRMLQ